MGSGLPISVFDTSSSVTCVVCYVGFIIESMLEILNEHSLACYWHLAVVRIFLDYMIEKNYNE